jgi:hypothetical protein
MSTETLFDLADFEETTPHPLYRDMFPCGVHERHRDDDAHAAECWLGVCPCCGEDVPSGFMMTLNHFGGEHGTCISVDLRLNHLTYAIRHGEPPAERDLTVIDLGWRIGPDGSQIPPQGKRRSSWGDAEEAVA